MNNIIISENNNVMQATPDEISKANQEVLEAISVETECCEELDHLETNLTKLKNILDSRRVKSKRVRSLMEAIAPKL